MFVIIYSVVLVHCLDGANVPFTDEPKAKQCHQTLPKGSLWLYCAFLSQ